MRVLAWCVMSTHWHFVLWPREDGDLSEFMRSAHGDAYAALARGASDGGNRPVAPRPLQVVPDSGRRPPSDRLAVRGAEPPAREHGGKGRCVAMVEPLASCAPQPCRLGGRRPGGASPALASARASCANRGGTGGATAFGGAWFAFRRRRLAAAHREAVRPSVDASPSRSPLAFCIRTKVKTPDPGTRPRRSAEGSPRTHIRPDRYGGGRFPQTPSRYCAPGTWGRGAV